MSLISHVNQHLDECIQNIDYCNRATRFRLRYASVAALNGYHKPEGITVELDDHPVARGVSIHGLDRDKVYETVWGFIAANGMPDWYDGPLSLMTRLHREYRIATKGY